MADLPQLQSRAPFSTWLGVVLLFALFGVISLAIVGPAPRTDTYEKSRAENRMKKLKDLRDEEAKALAAYAWIDKNKGTVRLPIERAMEITVAELAKKKPAAAGPIAAPEASAAPGGAAAASPAPTASPQGSGTPKPISVSGPNSESRGQPAAAVNPPAVEPKTQPGASATPAASPQSSSAVAPHPAASVPGSPAPPGSPLPVRGATPGQTSSQPGQTGSQTPAPPQ
ncbi:MAG: hypothetical protein DME57_07070 [Verrucomicrobia bacterium]|nr:MAG: hypothetical protein DME57_07070 [Verrucomicrobiota bacterium]